MKQAAARSRKGVVGKSGKKTPKVPKPTEKIPVIRKNRRRTMGLIIYYITEKFAYLKIAIKTPAAIAEPMTPATFGAMAWKRR